MNYRKATAEDAPTLLQMTRIAFERYAGEVGKSVAGATETLEDVLGDIEHKQVFVAMHGGEIVGSVRVQLPGKVAYLSRLCSLPDVQDLQVGHSLIEHLKSQLNVNALVLHTGTRLSGLVVFYYRCGFYIHSVRHDRGYPRGLLVCKLSPEELDYDALVQGL